MVSSAWENAARAVLKRLLLSVQQLRVPPLHQPLQLRQIFPVPGQVQPLHQQRQQLRRGLDPALLDLGQIRRRADAPAQALLAPAPLQPLLPQPQPHGCRPGAHLAPPAHTGASYSFPWTK